MAVNGGADKSLALPD